MCGGYRDALARLKCPFGYSPRVRGLSVNVLLIYECGEVFPPCAGVIGPPPAKKSAGRRIPPVCGGYRTLIRIIAVVDLYSPRVRGLSNALARLKCPFGVFPRLRGLSGVCVPLRLGGIVFPPRTGVIVRWQPPGTI